MADNKQGMNKDENKKIYGIRLIQAVKEKKAKLAFSLIDSGADVTLRDPVEWQPLHYAALEGMTDVIVKLIEHGATANCFDKNGQTPLHKAARRGHIESMVVLLANDAIVETVDWMGLSAFEFGVIERNCQVLETLMMFGAEPNLVDWTWTMNDKLTTKEDKILDLISRQLSLIPGYQYGGIGFKAAYVLPNESYLFKQLKITVDASEMDSAFLIYCCKMQSEYADFTHLLKNDTKMFSDVYECCTWRLGKKAIKMKFEVTGIPNVNEITYLISPSGSIGHIENMQRLEEQNLTAITATLRLNSIGTTQFAFAVEEKRETFQVAKEAVVIQPTMEPEAAIDIPEDTFDGGGELSLNVVETKNVNEDACNELGPLLLTNVLDLTMSDNRQPKHEIDMKLPIHYNDNNSDDICILATSEEFPDSPDDWEILEANSDRNGKAARFKVDHFSVYAGASRTLALKDKMKVVMAISQSLRKQRKVEMLVCTRLLKERGHFELLVECVTTPKAKERKRLRETQDYIITLMSDDKHVINEDQSFRLHVEGNMREISNENSVKLDFVGKQGFKSIILNMIVRDTDTPVVGTLYIDIEEDIEETIPVVAADGLFCRNNKVHEIKKKSVISKPFLKVPIAIDLPKIEEEEEPYRDSRIPENDPIQIVLEAEEFEKNNPTTVQGMNAATLTKLALKLDNKEAQNLGYQLLPANDVVNISERFIENTSVKILQKYRGKRPHFSQVARLARALIAINRADLANNYAMENNSDIVVEEVDVE